jgi:hypothetical protein
MKAFPDSVKGQTKHPDYGCWTNMKDRCLNPRTKLFPWYGGRGIKIHQPWVDSFQSFITYMGNRPSGLYSIERIDNNDGYVPGNVRWATDKEQANNTRKCHWLRDQDGSMLTLSQLAERHGLNRKTITSRIRLGWPEDKLAVPCNTGKRNRNARSI